MPKRTTDDRVIEILDGALHTLDYDENEQIRVFKRDDGREVIVVQANPFNLSRLYITGRPDGRNVDGYESYHALFQERLARHQAETQSDIGFSLTEDEWDSLFEESYDRYLRYLFFSGLNRWEDVKRDTDSNLDVCDWARKYADEETAWRVYQYKGYILMMNAISRAEIAMDEGDEPSAQAEIDRGVERIGAYCRECVLAGHIDAEQLTREHYLANILKYRDELIAEGRLEDASREDPRNVV